MLDYVEIILALSYRWCYIHINNYERIIIPMSMKPINVTIPEQMLETLNKHKQATGITLSELVRRACDMYFNSIAKQNQKEPPTNAQ